MKLIRTRLLIAALAVLVGSTIARSQTADAPPAMHQHEFGMGHGEHMLEFFTDLLNLSDAQQAQIKAVLQKEHGAMKPLHQQMHQIESQLRQYELGAYDEAKVRPLAAQKAQLETEMTVQKTRIHSELFQLLTPDQQTKLKEFVSKREARWQQHAQSEGSSAPQQ